MKLVKPLYPDKPHHPKQKYRLTDMGKAMMNMWSIENKKQGRGNIKFKFRIQQYQSDTFS